MNSRKSCPEELFQILYNRSLRFVSTWFHLHRDFHRNKESTKNLANSTMKKSFVPIVDFYQNSWTFVRLLLLFVSIAARLTMPFRGRICASFAQYWNLACLNEATSYSYRESILVGLNGGYGLHPPEHPIFGKVLRLDYFQSFDDEFWISYASIMDSLEILLLALLLQLVSIMVSVRSSFLDDVLRN